MADKSNESLSAIQEKLTKISAQLEHTQIAEYVQLLNRPRKLIAVNLLAGIARGIGIAIGVTLFTVLILYLLRALGALNLPIIGDFVADIVRIVESNLNGRPY